MKLIRERDLVERLGRSRTSIRRDISGGLMTPPVKFGPRNSIWPASEADAIAAAYVAGKKPDEIRALVANLVRERAHALDTVRSSAA